MSDSSKYKILVFVCINFLALLSLSTGFLLGPARTEGNVVFWVFKGITVAFLVFTGVLALLKSSTFSKMSPIVESALLAQLIPTLCRIGWTGEEPEVPILVLYLCAILTFVAIVVAVFFAISHKAFKEAEDKAIPSSNSNETN